MSQPDFPPSEAIIARDHLLGLPVEARAGLAGGTCRAAALTERSGARFLQSRPGEVGLQTARRSVLSEEPASFLHLLPF